MKDQIRTSYGSGMDEREYTLLAFGGIKTMAGQGDVEFEFLFLCRNESGQPVLIREYYDIHWGDVEGIAPSKAERHHLYRVDEELLSPEEAADCRSLMIPAESRTVQLPAALLPDVHDPDFCRRLLRHYEAHRNQLNPYFR